MVKQIDGKWYFHLGVAAEGPFDSEAECRAEEQQLIRWIRNNCAAMPTPQQQLAMRQLRKYIGKLVDVSSKVDGRRLGGEGVLTDVRFCEGGVWVDVDWGFSWIVSPDALVITELPPERA